MDSTERVHNMHEETTTNSRGGSQSKLTYTPHLVPADALAVLPQFFKKDLESGTMPWRGESFDVHVNDANEALAEYFRTNDTHHLFASFAASVKAVCVQDQKGKSKPATIPPEALLRIAEVTYHGRLKYGTNNWLLIHLTDHLDHAGVHLALYLTGDESDDHIGHALCRLAFAIGTLGDTGEENGWDFKKVRKVNTPTAA